MLYCLVLMLSVFAGSALGGHESDTNTWYGLDAGKSITSGFSNTFIGNSAGYSSTIGGYNSIIGHEAGFSSTGSINTFMGFRSGYSTTSNYNTFIGVYSGYSNTSGDYNAFLGHRVGYTNSTGVYNTFIGPVAGYYNTSGSYNTFIGPLAGYLENIDVENYNTLIGYNSNIEGTSDAVTNATAIGNRAYVSQSNSLVLGSINGVNEATSNVNVGIGTSAPVRQLHVVGEQAVFRMDRPADTAAFMLVRTDAGGTPLKTFVVGANASGSNNGSFVINDLGISVSGAGTRRMTIDNNGIATFTNSVYALSFVPTSSLVYKTNVKTYENALETVKKLRGVSFNWKDSGKPSVGLIAEEVDRVIPEVVAHDGQTATGLNYDSLVGVLVEAVKEQEGLIKQQESRHQAELKKQQGLIKEQQGLIQQQQKIIASHSEAIAELKRLLILSNAVSKAD